MKVTDGLSVARAAASAKDNREMSRDLTIKRNKKKRRNAPAVVGPAGDFQSFQGTHSFLN